ncbi:MAG: prolipoprotein diacylglyceryl transferase [Planctomycetota bacterium]|nr:prolipoprotein diacylglyceryl transferase [Planctomycetota bacterium]
MTIFLAEAYLHRLDPFAIEFPASWQALPFIPDGIRWYGLAYLAGFGIAWLLIRWLGGSGRSNIPANAVGDLMIYVILGVLVGGRLGYVLFYDQPLLWDFSTQFPFWGLVAINRGGMASHGGILGVIIACWLFGRRHRISPLHLVDVGAFAALPGLFLGRLANFVNAELWGRALPEKMQAQPPWWSVKYPQEILTSDLPRLHEKLDGLRQVVPGDETFYGNIIEAARAGNAQVIETLTPLLTAYYPSQILQAITDGPVLMGFLALLWWRPRKPGVIGSWFLIGYGVMRIVTELVRQPDEGVPVLATALGDVSRGQMLSLLMVAAGIVGLIVCARRQVDPIGGLMKLRTANDGRS